MLKSTRRRGLPTDLWASEASGDMHEMSVHASSFQAQRQHHIPCAVMLILILTTVLAPLVYTINAKKSLPDHFRSHEPPIDTVSNVSAEKHSVLSVSKLDEPFGRPLNVTPLRHYTVGGILSKHPAIVVVEKLLTEGAHATASVRGNLGPPSVVLDPCTADWLTDRWQAAKNMRGDAIPGRHWLELALKAAALNITKIVIDYEIAYSDDYEVEVFCDNGSGWVVIYKSKSRVLQRTVQKSEKHIVHTIQIDNPTYPCGESTLSISKIKLNIKNPADRWGTSVWRFFVWGYDANRTDVSRFF